MTKVNLVHPKVTLAAYTHPTQLVLTMLGLKEGDLAAAVQLTPEFGGRACYQSWEKKNPETATNAGYLRNIIRQKHFSVLEHSTVSFYVEGVSRSCSHEIVRHRHFGYSQLSQRYVDSINVAFIIPPALEDDDDALLLFKESCATDLEYYEWFQNHQMEKVVDGKKFTKKQARESARSVMPNGTETKILMTANLRSWMEWLVKRDNPAADAEIQRLAKLIQAELIKVAPDVFGPEARALWDDSYAQREARA